MYCSLIFLIGALWYVLMLSFLGFLTTKIIKLRMRYAAIFNMSVYAITLSLLLEIIYIPINVFTGFTIKYFDVMYVTVATIYLVAAIFIIKSEFIKKQAELMKILEMQEEVKRQLEQQENQKNKETDKKDEPKDKEKEENKSTDKKQEKQEKKEPEEPEGSNA